MHDGELLHGPGERDVEQAARGARRGTKSAGSTTTTASNSRPLASGGAEDGDRLRQPPAGRLPNSTPAEVSAAVTSSSTPRGDDADRRQPRQRRTAAAVAARGAGGAAIEGRTASSGPSGRAGRQGRPPGGAGWRRRGSAPGPGSRARAPRSSPAGATRGARPPPPSSLGTGSGGLGEVAEDRHRARRAPAGDGPQLHRREVLCLVHHHVAVGATDPVEERLGLVDEHQLGERPGLVVDAPGAGRPAEQGLLVGGRGSPRRRGEGSLVGEDALHEHGRRQRRPDPAHGGVQVRVRAHLGVERRRRCGVLPPGVGVAEPGQARARVRKAVRPDREGHVARRDLLDGRGQRRGRDAQRDPTRC